jgi:hypothetical protein
LPPGIHRAKWEEMEARFGLTVYRKALIDGLRKGVLTLKTAGCRRVYVDGSFVTAKVHPRDYDACWDIAGVDPNLLDPVFLNFNNHRAAQKMRFLGEFFPAQLSEGMSGRTFLEFFQIEKNTGRRKGIVALSLGRLSS